jgi:hypothetical protein
MIRPAFALSVRIAHAIFDSVSAFAISAHHRGSPALRHSDSLQKFPRSRINSHRVDSAVVERRKHEMDNSESLGRRFFFKSDQRKKPVVSQFQRRHESSGSSGWGLVS